MTPKMAVVVIVGEHHSSSIAGVILILASDALSNVFKYSDDNAMLNVFRAGSRRRVEKIESKEGKLDIIIKNHLTF